MPRLRRPRLRPGRGLDHDAAVLRARNPLPRGTPAFHSLIRPPRGFAQKNQGYWTSSAGKIFHDGMDDPPSWTYPSNQTAVSQHSRQRLPDGFLQTALF